MAADTGEFGDKKPVPVFFVMNRWALKKATLRKAPISCVAVLNYQGSDQNFKEMNEMLPELKNAYQQKLNDPKLSYFRRYDPGAMNQIILKSVSSSVIP